MKEINKRDRNKTIILSKCKLLLFVGFSILLLVSCEANQHTPVSTQQREVTKSLEPKPSYVIAFKKGHYENALKEVRPLAERGDIAAQNTLGLM
ncbi:MAG: hypothetical protein ABFD63_06085, partial [Smithella sp.]